MGENSNLAVLVEQRGHILIATINRPEARNAVNAAVHVGLGEALETAEKNPEIRVVILTGAGDQAFCAGADLKALSRGERLEPEDKVQRRWGFAGVVQHPISKPVIAAVNGFALGGGTELALYADLVVASDHAQFGLPEVNLYIGNPSERDKKLIRTMEFSTTDRTISCPTPLNTLRKGIVVTVISSPNMMIAEEIVRGEFLTLAEIERRATIEPFCPDGVAVLAEFQKRRS